VASIGISQVVERGGGTKEVQTTPIYVAMKQLAIGEELGPKAIKIEEWPNDKIPEGAIKDVADLEGMRPKQPLYSGEPILMAKLAKQEDLVGTARRIKKGYRVAAVKVTRESAVAGLIFPGDHVDVMSFVHSNGRGTGPRAKTILTNVEVFAINDRIDRVLDGEGNSIDAKTVSLLVKPQAAKNLMYYSNLGPLNLTLRRPDDDSGEPETDFEPIATVAAPPAPKVEPVVLEDDNRFVMEIFEGGGTQPRRFKIDEDGSTEEVSESTTQSGSTTRAASSTAAQDADLPFPSGEPNTSSDDDLPPPRDGGNEEPGDDLAEKIDWSFLSE
jgi:pilus assembly protein CpaB